MCSCELYDMHFHLGFSQNIETTAAGMRAAGLGGLCATVTPREYRELAGCTAVSWGSCLRLGVGLHPWWVAGDGSFSGDGTGCEGDAPATCLGNGAQREAADAKPTPMPRALQMAGELAELAKNTQFIAEVGLDFSTRHAASQAEQRAAFERICSVAQGKVMSVHAVRSADAVLDALERNNLAGKQAAPGTAIIFHWFSGTSQQLTRAISAGCYFSVNPRMLESKRGRAYVQAIPEKRLLLESDLPAHAEGAYEASQVRGLLENTVSAMAELRNCNSAALAAAIAQTSQALLT